jgi:superfamily I DNA/RNA helicase
VVTALKADSLVELLNPDQRRALEPARTLVVAPPGSGKTRTIVAKCAALLLANPSCRIAAITFTRDAADELKHRLTMAAPGSRQRVLAGTFHSIAMRQLKKAGISRRVVSPTQQYQLVRRAWYSVGVGQFQDLEEAVRVIEHHKANALPAPAGSREQRLLTAYNTLLQEYHSLDFTDLLAEAVSGMRQGSVARLAVDAILVDEFQDTDDSQYAWLLEHRAVPTVMAVGDDDQSIYGWRSAGGFAAMLRFEKDFQATRIVLRSNYRSHDEIIRCANRLVENNDRRVPKQILAIRGMGGQTSHLRADTRDAEISAIQEAVSRKPGDWAVLARTNALVDQVEAMLSATENTNGHGIPYKRLGGRRLWDREHAAVFIALLHAVHSQEDLWVSQLLQWLGCREEDIRELRKRADTLYQAVQHRVIPEQASERLQVALLSLPAVWRAWSGLVADPSRLAMSIGDWMIEQRRSERIREDIANIAGAVARMKSNLSTRLRVLDGLVTAKPDTASQNGQAVTISTMHGSKGLEFNRVWVMGLSQGTCPNDRGDLAEERRLFYVAVTRARHELVVSCSTKTGFPSRFIREAGLATGV